MLDLRSKYNLPHVTDKNNATQLHQEKYIPRILVLILFLISNIVRNNHNEAHRMTYHS